MQVAQVNDTLRITWQNHTMDLDMVPGVDVASVEAILAPQPDRVNVRWSRCKSRVALLHIYDSLIAIGVPVNPPKADALLAWEELHPPPTLVSPNPDSTELQLGPVSQGARVIILNNGFDPLLKMDNEMYINHVWAICTALRFPLQSFEMAHVAIASELFQRCTADTNPENSGIRPQVFVRSYRYQGVVSPLLLWYKIQEHEVLCALQEFLHVRFPYVPQAVVWHWQLLPYHTNIANLGQHFDRRQILPSLRSLLRFAAVGVPVDQLDLSRLNTRAQFHPDRISMEYGSGQCALFLGEDIFFYMEDKSEKCPNPLLNVRLPASHTELPTWVMHILYEASKDMDAFAIARNVDSYLLCIASNVPPAIRLLQSVNWASIPLIWKPLFMRNAEVVVTPTQASQAQARLIKELAPTGEEPETIAEAIEILHQFTGV